MEKLLAQKAGDCIFALPKKGKVDLVAQLVEHNTFNVGALGSSPSGITGKSLHLEAFSF